MLNPRMWALMLALITATIWSFVALERLAERVRAGSQVELPEIDHVLNDLRLQQYDAASGALRLDLTASRLQHEREALMVRLEEPRLTGAQADATLSALARAGRLDRQGRLVFLEREVVVQRVRAGEPPLVARLDRLTVEPDRKRAYSADRVEIRQGDSRLLGTGLEVDLAEEQFHLLADVVGRFLPPRRSP